MEQPLHNIILGRGSAVLPDAVLLDDLVDFHPQPVGLGHEILAHSHIGALDGVAGGGVLGEEAELGDGLLTLNPPSHAHGIPLQELRGHQRGAPALGQPVPGGLIDFGGDERSAVLLSGGEHGGGLGHGLALQIGGGVEVGDGEPPPARVALGDLIRQGLFLGSSAHTSAAPVGAVFGHDSHLLLLPGVYTLFETAILRK